MQQIRDKQARNYRSKIIRLRKNIRANYKNAVNTNLLGKTLIGKEKHNFESPVHLRRTKVPAGDRWSMTTDF